jgi:uncharacterized protein
MGNIAYFEIPSEDVERAKKFYASVFGWDIRKSPMPEMPDYTMINTGKTSVEEGMGQLNMGGITKRAFPGQPITNYIEVENIDKTLELVKKMGGKTVGKKMKVDTVGFMAFIKDTEGNVIGLWEPEKK